VTGILFGSVEREIAFAMGLETQSESGFEYLATEQMVDETIDAGVGEYSTSAALIE